MPYTSHKGFYLAVIALSVGTIILLGMILIKTANPRDRLSGFAQVQEGAASRETIQ